SGDASGSRTRWRRQGVMGILTLRQTRGKRTRSIAVGLAVLAALLMVFQQRTRAQSSTVPEYQVKATFLFQFTQFVDWPARSLPPAQTPLVIGILGQDPFGTFLDETVR